MVFCSFLDQQKLKAAKKVILEDNLFGILVMAGDYQLC